MKKFLYWVLMILCTLIFCFSAYKLYEIWQSTQVIKNETEQLQAYVKIPEKEDETFSVDWESLKKENADVVAWILIPGTDINYPVVQGPNNDYYLDRSLKGEYVRQGSIFLDANTANDFSGDNSLIYGHSVDIGGMFTSLNKFEDLSFFDSTPYFWLLTPQQNYKAEIFAFSKIPDSSAAYTSDFGSFKETILEKVRNQAMYTRPVDFGEYKLVTLSTCNLDYGYDSDQRLVLSAVLVPTSQNEFTVSGK